MVRFFTVVGQSPPYGLVVLGIVTAIGLATIGLNPAELDSALGLVLFVQMFLASSGFVVTARRGHFDPMLVHGSERGTALIVQWCASIAPGAIAWAIVAGVGYEQGSPAAWSAIAGSRLAAFLIVSALAWVLGFRLPRGAGGALWMGLLIVMLLRHVELVAPAATRNTPLVVLRTMGAVLVCPYLLLGTHAQIGVPAVLASCAAAVAVLLATIRLGRRMDVYLVERS